MQRDEGTSDAGKELRWQEAKRIAAVVPLPEIVARPDKLVAFGNHDPRRVVVKAEMALHGERNFNGPFWPLGLAMGDR